MAKIFFTVLFLMRLVIFNHADDASFLACLRPVMAKYIFDSTTATIPTTAVLFSPDVYLPLLPYCIRNVKKSTMGSCAMNFNTATTTGRNLTPLKEIFVCINEESSGSQLQKEGATAILWSGKGGKGRAERLHTEHKSSTPWNWSGTKGKYPDTKVSVLGNYLMFAGMAGKTADVEAAEAHHPVGYEKMLIDLSCMWLIYNSDPQSHSNKMHDYASLAAYEEHAGKPNQGKGSLLHNGITSGLVINNYFWTVEVPTIARLYSFIDYSGIEDQSRASAALELHLRTYTLNVRTNSVTPNAWATHNLFGALGDLANIKVIFEGANHLQYPIFKGRTPDATVTTADLFDLITEFNTGRASADRITEKLHMDLPKLLNFIHWTTQIPFKNFDAASHKRGGWATHTVPLPASDVVPASDVAFAQSAPYNKLGHKFHHKEPQAITTVKDLADDETFHDYKNKVLVPYNPYTYERYNPPTNPTNVYNNGPYLLDHLLMFLCLLIGICVGFGCGSVGLCAYCGLKVFDKTQKNYDMDEQNIV